MRTRARIQLDPLCQSRAGTLVLRSFRDGGRTRVVSVFQRLRLCNGTDAAF